MLCARGGYGSIRIIDRIDYDAIAGHAKPFIGYSDITALMESLVRRAGMVCFHGPMGIDLIGKGHARSIAKLGSIIGGKATRINLRPKDFSAYRTGAASGILKGGDIANSREHPAIRWPRRPPCDPPPRGHGRVCLSARPLAPPSPPRRLFRQRCRDDPRRSQPQGRRSGKLARRFLPEIIDSHFSDFDGPVALGVPCGHTQFQLTIPLGCEARLRVSDEKMSLGFGNTLGRTDRKGPEAAAARRLSGPFAMMRGGGVTLAGGFRSYLGKRA